MALPQCWTCFRTPLRPVRISAPAGYFSAKPSSGSLTGNAQRSGPSYTTYAKKKKAIARTTRPPARGERKALRNRIILNNPSALDVRGLQHLSKDLVRDTSVAGSVVTLPDDLVEKLRAVQAFKRTQKWSSFRKPAVLLTGQMMDLTRELEGVDSQSDRKTITRLFSGERGAGKSTMLLQAMATAFLKGWVVMSIPQCQDLTIAHTAYAPVPNTKPVKYVQERYTASLLAQILRANEAVLSTLRLSRRHALDLPISPGLSLAGLAKLGAQDSNLAWPIFEVLWQELTIPPSDGQAPRPPLMITIDSINHIMRLSHYRDANFNPIHAHDLLLVHHLLSYLSGAKSLPNGGAILAATSMSNTPSTPTFSLALRQHEARAAGQPAPPANPFELVDHRVTDVMSSPRLDVTRLRGLNRAETRALLEYYAASGLLRERVDERSVGEKWSLAGGGIIGEVEKVALMRIS